jgi:hypothetical protein
MTNHVGIHCARVLAGTRISPVIARNMLIDELQLTADQAETVVDEAYAVRSSASHTWRRETSRQTANV